jgi:hypothetical protein
LLPKVTISKYIGNRANDMDLKFSEMFNAEICPDLEWWQGLTIRLKDEHSNDL